MESSIVLIIMIAVFMLLFTLPEKKKNKAVNKMRSELKPGDDVTTSGGIYGTVCAVKENSIVIETGADRVRLEMAKAAIVAKGIQIDNR